MPYTQFRRQRRPRRRDRAAGAPARWIGCLLAAGLGLAALQLSTGSAGAAAPPASQSTGRFLSGTVGGADLDTIAAIEGESAQSLHGQNVTRYNSLDASALSGAVRLPLTNVLRLPGGNVLSLGAVSQYANANADGSALGASGAISNSGGIAVGGQQGAAPANASLDLAGAGGSAVAGTLGNLKLNFGALSARAMQSAGSRGSQRGNYLIAGLSLDLSAPALAALISPLITQVRGTVAGLDTAFTGLGLPVTVTGINHFPDAGAQLSSVGAGQGAITASLADGRVHIDVAKLLAASGLDLNQLPPNTHLMPYLAKALSTALPSAITGLIGSLQAKFEIAFGNLGFSVAGTPLTAAQLAQLAAIRTGLQKSVAKSLSAAAGELSTAVFEPLAAQLGRLLDVVVNLQSVSGGTFTERAVQLDLGGSQALLNLASASVGPSKLAPAPVHSQVLGVSASRSPEAIPRSEIKIDAGRPTARHSYGALPVLGVLLLIYGAGGVAALRVRSASAARHG
jgi:hypothetical protein